MKKLTIITAALSLSALSAFSQGTILFNNSATTLVTTNGVLGIANNSVRVELFYQPGSPTAPSPYLQFSNNGYAPFIVQGSWETTAVTFVAISANGRFVGGTESTGSDVAPSGNVWLTVVGWSGGFANLQAAIDGGAEVGVSTIWEQATGGGGTPPANAVAITASPVIAGTAFSGVTIGIVPEPTTLALGGLGAAALLFYRRRK